MEKFIRTESLIGKEGLEKLKRARVAVFGIGGVGSYTVEALARAGVGAIDLIDKDVVSESNINRQLIATVDTVGLDKVEVSRTRILSINPDCKVTALKLFYLPENALELDMKVFSYVADAVDTVTAKLTIIEAAKRAGVPVISAMGTGDKLDPSAFRAGDLFETSGDGLARVMRKECRKRGIESLKVIYSTEKSLETEIEDLDPGRRHTPGSISFVPSVAGLIMAGEIIKDILKEN